MAGKELTKRMLKGEDILLNLREINIGSRDSYLSSSCTALNLEQAQNILEGKKVKGVNRDDERELLNYKKTMDFISKYLGKDDPVSEGIVREVHKILVKGVRGENADPGNYRKIQNYVVNSRTREVVYTPPAPLDVPHLMREFTKWVSKAEDVSPVLAAGIAQF
jgi:Fic family protein